MTQQIPLSRGLFALVDDDDYEWLSCFKWAAFNAARKGTPPRFYALRSARDRERRYKILMHREISNAPRGMVTDHRDLNTLDNRKINLRICTQGQNSLNHRGYSRQTSSPFKGVSWNKKNETWIADFRGKYIGSFKIEEDAARAYDVVASLFDPEFAVSNFDENGNPRPFQEATVIAAPARQNSSRQKGVSWNRWKNKWTVQLSGKHYGTFSKEDGAISLALSVLARME